MSNGQTMPPRRRSVAGRVAGVLVPAALAASIGAAQAQPDAGPAPASGRALAVCADPSNLPYSNQRQQGFENRIAALLADDLHASLRFTWNMQRRSFLRRTLNAGACDVVIGLPLGLQGVAQTRAYYGSSYVFVTRRQPGLPELPLQGFDDPRLRPLKIGLQAVGAEGANTPPAMALARRGLVDRITGYPMWGDEADETPQGRIVDAVASGEIDVAIVWGPFAGYFAQAHAGQLALSPVAADPQQPALAFHYEMALSVRRSDGALRDELQQVLDRRQADIQAILREFGVPLANAASAATAALPFGAVAETTMPNPGPMALHSGD
jgi:mxaJ protein